MNTTLSRRWELSGDEETRPVVQKTELITDSQREKIYTPFQYLSTAMNEKIHNQEVSRDMLPVLRKLAEDFLAAIDEVYFEPPSDDDATQPTNR